MVESKNINGLLFHLLSMRCSQKDGTVVDINIGEDDNDPVFCVTDLLIHLAQEQMQKKCC